MFLYLPPFCRVAHVIRAHDFQTAQTDFSPITRSSLSKFRIAKLGYRQKCNNPYHTIDNNCFSCLPAAPRLAYRRGSSGRVPDVRPIFSESYRFVPADVRRNRAAEEHENWHQTRCSGRRQLGRTPEHGKRRQRDDFIRCVLYWLCYVFMIRPNRSGERN